MINGIINVNKEKDYTSHDVVAKLRGILKQKKIGHTGTLDPNACGVLPVCLGKATKVSDLLADKDKTYEAVLLLGLETDTQDVWGKVLRKNEVGDLAEKITASQIEEVIYSFRGNYEQIPPMYSAVKINGKKLYELARAGKEIERKPRKVEIKNIEILDIHFPRINIKVDCSKGTYIRTLCHDIGNKLGCFGCMEELLRTRVERFTLENSLTLSEIETIYVKNDLKQVITPIEKIFDHYPKTVVLDKYQRLLFNGNSLRKEYFREIPEEASLGIVRVYDEHNKFAALYEFDHIAQAFKIVKMFLD